MQPVCFFIAGIRLFAHCFLLSTASFYWLTVWNHGETMACFLRYFLQYDKKFSYVPIPRFFITVCHAAAMYFFRMFSSQISAAGNFNGGTALFFRAKFVRFIEMIVWKSEERLICGKKSGGKFCGPKIPFKKSRPVSDGFLQGNMDYVIFVLNFFWKTLLSCQREWCPSCHINPCARHRGWAEAPCCLCEDCFLSCSHKRLCWNSRNGLFRRGW